MIKFLKGITHLPWRQMFDVLRVFAFGAWKHRNDLWFEGECDSQHFWNKHARHMMRWSQGEKKDLETGLHPLSHAICDLLMAWALEVRDGR